MTQRVTDEDGTVHNFPDEATPEMISEALGLSSGDGAQSKQERSYGAGVMQGIGDSAYGISQLAPRAISAVTSGFGVYPNKVSKFYAEDAKRMDAAVKKREADYQASGEDEGIDWGRLTGNVISPVNYIPGSATKLMSKATSLLGRAAQGAAIGGAYAATTPVTGNGDFAQQKLGQIGTGAGTGFAIPVIGESIARAVNPVLDKSVKTLRDAGIRLTPGQIFGGVAKSAEDRLTSVPLLGDSITAARQRGLEDSNVAVANRALSPIGGSVPKNIKAGRDLINHVEEKLGKAYDDVIPKLTGKIDDGFTANMAQLNDMVNELPEPMQKQFRAIVENNLIKKTSQVGFLTGESIKRAESVLGQKSRAYMKSLDPDQRDLGNALRQVQANIRDMLARQNPEHAGTLKSINQGWANFERMRGAAGMLGAPEGVFSAAQLANQVKKMGGRNQYARGDALLQDMSEAAKSTLPSKYPDSGTAGRYLLGAGAFGSGFLSPATLTALLAGAGAYTRPGIATMDYLAAAPKLGKYSAPTADAIRSLTSPADLARFFMGASRAPQLPSRP